MTKSKGENLWNPTTGKVTEVDWGRKKYLILNFLENSTLFFKQLKVKQSHYRPGQALRVPGG